MNESKLKLELAGLAALFVFGLTMLSAPAIVFSATATDSSSSSSSSSGASSSDKGSSKSDKHKPETTPPKDNPSSSTTITTEPVNPINPNPDITTPANPEKPIIPTVPGPVITNPPTTIPDKGCAFHPESPKCAPDRDGNCPAGFAHNDKGNCFPEGRCPTGSSRHTDDESGKCFPGPHRCPPSFHLGTHHKCSKDIVINIHKHTTTGSSGSSHSLSGKCFDEIKIAWLGKIKRGNNEAVDIVIDKCLGVSNLP